jgi:hypothetical protein
VRWGDRLLSPGKPKARALGLEGRGIDLNTFRAGLGSATATTAATFLPQFEHRIRVASFASVTDRPAIRASASGSATC